MSADAKPSVIHPRRPLDRRTTARLPVARRGRAIGSAVVILSAVGMVVLPVAGIEFPREVARWYVAAALENYLNGDLDCAVVDLDRAISWHGQDPSMYLQRAEFKLRLKQWQSGLEDCDRARKLKPDDSEIGVLRSQFLQHLGRHRAATAEWRELLRDEFGGSPSARAFLLNNLAYVRAVGKLDLDEGLTDINEALSILGNRLPALDPAGVLYFGRACTELLREHDDAAVEDLNEAAKRAEAIFHRTKRQVQSLASDPRGAAEYAEDLNALRPHLAGILKMRSELLVKMNRLDEAKRDGERLDALKSDGNGSYAEPYDLGVAIDRVSRYASYLDTRGYLYYQLGKYEQARLDIEKAVTSSEWLYQATEWQVEIFKNEVTDIRQLKLRIQAARQTLAVVMYHRLLVREALEVENGAAEDRATIVKLGFEPDEHLF